MCSFLHMNRRIFFHRFRMRISISRFEFADCVMMPIRMENIHTVWMVNFSGDVVLRYQCVVIFYFIFFFLQEKPLLFICPLRIRPQHEVQKGMVRFGCIDFINSKREKKYGETKCNHLQKSTRCFENANFEPGPDHFSICESLKLIVTQIWFYYGVWD